MEIIVQRNTHSVRWLIILKSIYPLCRLNEISICLSVDFIWNGIVIILAY